MTAVSVSGFSANPNIDKPSSTSPRYQTLDHWRGIACLLVVIHHTLLAMCDHGRPEQIHSSVHTVNSEAIEKSDDVHPTAQGPVSQPRLRNRISDQLHIGVEMFFVISGYCITASAQSIRRSGRSIREYFLRRFLRIFPPFWFALIGSVLICFVIDFFSPSSLKRAPWPLPMPWDLSFFQWVGSVTLTDTWIGSLTGESKMHFPIQEWTLCYEMQFYVVIGVLLALSGHRFFQAVAFLTAGVATLDFLVLCYPIPVRGFFFDEHWFMFAAGVGLYWDLHCATPKQARFFRMFAVSVLVGLTILATTTTIVGNGSQFSAWRVVKAIGFAGLLLFLKTYDERIASLYYLNGFKSCGVICYSIYLTHLFPAKFLSQQLSFLGYHDNWSIAFVCIPLTLTMSVLLGYVFHVSVERRFLIGHYDLARRQPRSNAIKTSDTPCETLYFNQLNRAASTNSPVKKAA
jgi:peptidoglycan/LPS O-acetylase OafA/YrhL